MRVMELTIFIKEVANNPGDILNRLNQIVELYNGICGKENWFLPGESKEDGMKWKIFHDGVVSDDAMLLMTNYLKDDLPFVTSAIWSLNEDSIKFGNYIQGDVNKFSYEINHCYKNEAEAMNFASQFVLKIIDKISPHILRLETNGYSLHESQVFPDRLPVGWMFYIDKSYDEKTLNLPKQMHSIKREGQPIGTLFVTKRDFFDGSNKADITLSNDLEIALVAHDILPTYKKIF
ncbi:hypothetical protein ENT52713_30020 [Enterobacter sp. 200527-13]|uniref:Imm52 family immunity protein n=1 Tax=Enterobacter sp. 200527-13 TaxID=2995131 RepID=UPI0022C9E820|nr:Imm52 family immunity protein [Enterobacter sp. 200527-13]GLH25606.1 hypothetical protein ENT52713_30020 [Enterobacter sp. 200527-13]